MGNNHQTRSGSGVTNGIRAVTPWFREDEMRSLYMCPRCSNHTYKNNMVNRYNILLNYKLISYKITLGLERRLQSSSDENLSVGAAYTSTTRGEACLASFFFVLPVPLILTPTFDSIERNDRGKLE
jgi:hypothetical protein